MNIERLVTPLLLVILVGILLATIVVNKGLSGDIAANRSVNWDLAKTNNELIDAAAKEKRRADQLQVMLDQCRESRAQKPPTGDINAKLKEELMSGAVFDHNCWVSQQSSGEVNTNIVHGSGSTVVMNGKERQ